MSYSDFEKAMTLAPKCRFYTTVGGRSDEEIKKSETLLALKFSKQCNEFYKKYGYLSFFGHEIYGLDPKDDSGILEGNSLAYALNDREKYALPPAWLPIYNYDDGNMAYLDFSSLNKEGEPAVIMAFYNGASYEKLGLIAEDLGAFVLQLVEEALNNQDNTAKHR